VPPSARSPAWLREALSTRALTNQPTATPAPRGYP
jgi:hypothetical protein